MFTFKQVLKTIIKIYDFAFQHVRNLSKTRHFRMREHRAIFKVDIPTSSSHATGPALQTRTKVGGVVEIYNVNGKLVLQEYIAPWSQFKQMELSHLNKGIYFCKVRWQDSTGQVKVVIE